MRYLLLGFTLTIGPFLRAQALLQLDTTQYDVGFLQEGAPCQVDIPFRNAGKEPLVIYRAVGTVGFADVFAGTPGHPDFRPATWVPNGVAFPPGKKGFLRYHYETQGCVGPFNREIVVFSEPATPSPVATVRGEVVYRPARATVQALNGDLRTVAPGATDTLHVLVRNESDIELHLGDGKPQARGRNKPLADLLVSRYLQADGSLYRPPTHAYDAVVVPPRGSLRGEWIFQNPHSDAGVQRRTLLLYYNSRRDSAVLSFQRRYR